ncbi:hypothetical protein L218DRAFT_1006923 [Marasmius fiardii PR-910]|nr:hypothetical protein L218DRAFT_951667 [Marasmius fiardii PR-910]KAF9254308.1 hypothetical protein L218DRAFT_1009848 [Marasmius fiardii PR-910]KAF9256802.1 hypothetical protein L218DRAFT_1006923 [Marasmius fiardii PR-910]
MLCLLLAPFVSLLFIGSAFTTPLTRRSVADVQNNINIISVGFTTLGNTTTAFPNATEPLAAALFVRAVMKDVGLSLEKGKEALDIIKQPFNDTDGPAIYDAIEALQPAVINAMQAFVDRKAAFQSLSFGGDSMPVIILQDLQALAGVNLDFLNKVNSGSHPNNEARALNATTPIYRAIDGAIAVYV